MRLRIDNKSGVPGVGIIKRKRGDFVWVALREGRRTGFSVAAHGGPGAMELALRRRRMAGLDVPAETAAELWHRMRALMGAA